MELVSTAGSIGGGVCANYIYAYLTRNSDNDLGLHAYLNLPDQVLGAVEKELATFARAQHEKYRAGDIKPAERYFKAIVDDDKPTFLYPLLESLFFEPTRAISLLIRDLRSFVEINDHIDAEKLAREILSQLEMHIGHKVPLFDRLVQEVERAKKTSTLVEESYNLLEHISQKKISDKDVGSYMDYVVERNRSMMLSGFDSFLKRDAFISDLESSFVSLHVDNAASKHSQSISAEEVIEVAKFACLRGSPGCGKTTLLQWMSLRSCEHRGSIPFLIPLRTIVSKYGSVFSYINCLKSACSDEDLLEKLGKDWMSSCLEQHSCLVMLDGVDEIPFEHRSSFWSFVKKIQNEHSKARIVVTSRNLFHTHDSEGFFKDPTKMNENSFSKAKWEWDPPGGFLDFRILGLRRSDLNTFIDRWHAGIEKTRVHPDIISELDTMRHQLKQALLPENDTFGLGVLARTPMFCALLCLVNLLSKGKLPNTPKSLYGAALDILVQSRDEIRGVPIPRKFEQLDKPARKQIMGFIAYSMQEASALQNEYQLEEKIETVQEWVNLFRKNYASDIFVDVSDAEIVEFLIDRIAVIRQPTGGFVDFAHRSFLEYLAAEHFVSFRPKSAIPNLCKIDQWHGTIRFLIDSENGSETYNGEVLSQLARYVTDVNNVEVVQDFVESVFELLHNVPFASYEQYVALIRKMRPITKDRAPRYRNVPIRILQSALEKAPESGERTMLEKAYIYMHHTSDLALKIVESEYCEVKTDDFIFALNESRRVPLKKQYALLNIISAGGNFLRTGGGIERLFIDDLRVLRDTFFQLDNRVGSDTLLHEAVISSKTLGIFDPRSFDHIGEVHIDTWDVDFTISAIKHIRENYRGILIRVNRSLPNFEVEQYKDVYFFED